MSEWGSHNKYSKMAITNNFVTLKHGHIVATELSRAQLCLLRHVDIVENLVVLKKCKRNARVLFFLCSEARLVQKQPGKRQANIKKVSK